MYTCHVCESKSKKIVCTFCGVPIKLSDASKMRHRSTRYAWKAITLAWLGYIGFAGIHRLYIGRVLSGIIMLAMSLPSVFFILINNFNVRVEIMFMMVVMIGIVYIWTSLDLKLLWDNELTDQDGYYLRERGDMS